MKLLIKIALLIILPIVLDAQTNPTFRVPTKKSVDSIRLVQQRTNNDTLRMAVWMAMANYNFHLKVDSAIYYEEQALALARKLKLKLWEAYALDLLGASLVNSGAYAKALQILLAAQKIAEDEECEKSIWNIAAFTNDKNPETARLNILAAIHSDKIRLYKITSNHEEKLKSIFECKRIAESNADSTVLSLVYLDIGDDHFAQGNSDSARFYFQNAFLCAKSSGFKFIHGSILNALGRLHLKTGDFILAKKYILDALEENQLQNSGTLIAGNYLSLSDYFRAVGKIDSALFSARKALQIYHSVSVPNGTLRAYQSLAFLYKLKNHQDSAFHYLQLAFNLNDSLNNSEKVRQFQNIGFNELLKVEQLEKDKIELQNNIRMYAMLGGLGVFSIIAIILYRNNRQKQKANQVLESTLTNLKFTQTQLIQSEKMASLGELTAGIAHEIQNPLNFVNNFSEVNKELLVEMNEEIEKGNLSEAKALAKDIIDNEEKIRHHGMRADGIVKGMLQHSRSSSGIKEPTDINALADEYLRLAYHGLRAKDKSFNAKFETNFDESIGNVNVIPQDLGRVVLNLITNAFYAVTEKKASTGSAQYEPTVTVSTRQGSGTRGSIMGITDIISITVKDNGNGIPLKVLDKIFQPFFTTKPTGQGTGLGLSMSYDIVKKHGGELKVETKEGEGSEFVIVLPV